MPKIIGLYYSIGLRVEKILPCYAILIKVSCRNHIIIYLNHNGMFLIQLLIDNIGLMTCYLE